MYSKLVVGFAMAGAASAAGIVRRDTGAGGHSHDHGGSSGYAAPPASYSAPEPSYAAPAPSYDAPAPSYGAPAPSYGAPAPAYGAPAPSYGAPAPSYGAAPVYGYEEDEGVGFCIECIIIPWLILFGLSLLFPTITSVAVNNSGRKKREDSSPMNDVVERVNSIYMSVLESEECMERIACELGGLATDVGLGLKDNTMAKMADPFVPEKYKGYYKQFKSGQNCHKLKCGNIF